MQLVRIFKRQLIEDEPSPIQFLVSWAILTCGWLVYNHSAMRRFTMHDIDKQRLASAETAFEEFEFDESSVPEETGGWESDGLGNYTRVLFLPNLEDASGPTVKGQFNVSFDVGSVVPDHVWASLDGQDIGRRPKIASAPKP